MQVQAEVQKRGEGERPGLARMRVCMGARTHAHVGTRTPGMHAHPCLVDCHACAARTHAGACVHRPSCLLLLHHTGKDNEEPEQQRSGE